MRIHRPSPSIPANESTLELLNHAVNGPGMTVAEVQNGMQSAKFRKVMEDVGPYFDQDKARLDYIQREAARRGVPIRIAAQEIPDLYAI